MMPRDAESETQWQITWFPPDRSDVVRTGTERQVRKMAELQADWHPIIEKREIVVGAWELVENKSAGIVEGDPCPKHRALGANPDCPDCDPA